MRQVLLVEDNGADVLLMQRSFRERAPEFGVRAVPSVTAARAALIDSQVDILIADLMLPDGNGMELIAAAHARGCPTIMLTGRGSESMAVQALRAGAVDYIVKSDDHFSDMPRVVKRAVREWDNLIEMERNRSLLAQSEQRFRTFAELAADCFWESDPELKLTFVSEGFVRISRLQREILIGTPLKDALGNPDQGFDWAVIESLWQELREFEFEIPIARNGHAARTLYVRGKPFCDARGEVVGFRGIGRDVTREHDALREITYLAMHDPLTDVLNRRSLEIAVSNALSGVVCNGDEHVLCYFDVDAFKDVNDRAGHVVGDGILKELVATIQRNVRSTDALGRMGGDEFAVLLKHCGLPRAIEITQAVVAAVGDLALPQEVQPLRLTLSAGLVLLKPGQDLGQVFREADRACYLAKRAGGNTVRTA